MPKGNQHKQIAKWFFVGVSAVLIYFFWRMIEPYALTLVTAMIFAVLFSPVDEKIRTYVKNAKLSGFITTLLAFLVIFVPLTFLSILVVQEATDLVQNNLTGNQVTPVAEISELDIVRTLPEFLQNAISQIDVVEVTRSAVSWLQSNLGRLLANSATFVFQVFLFFILFFYLTVQRKRIHKEVLELSPFDDKLDENIVARITKTVRGVMFGALIIASIQAVFATVGMLIFGVPKAFLWGSFVLIAAQVPLVGVGLVMVPAISYLALTGSTGAAIGLAIWAVIVVGLVDNLLSPVLVGKRTKMPEVLVLISILGGLQLFGPIGFIVGPVILSGLLVLRDLYKDGILEKK